MELGSHPRTPSKPPSLSTRRGHEPSYKLIVHPAIEICFAIAVRRNGKWMSRLLHITWTTQNPPPEEFESIILQLLNPATGNYQILAMKFKQTRTARRGCSSSGEKIIIPPNAFGRRSVMFSCQDDICLFWFMQRWWFLFEMMGETLSRSSELGSGYNNPGQSFSTDQAIISYLQHIITLSHNES